MDGHQLPLVAITQIPLKTWLSAAFWDQISEHVVAWAMRALPAVFIILVLASVLMRLAGALLNRLKPRMLRHMLEGHAADPFEIEKQVETLFGILSATVRVAVGTVAAMLVLRNIGIDIAPILAGAGVVGLAVGFGAQELVRDVISGFFMLLENYIRQGDVVQVNGTGGTVEKVGLRTIVLRDVAGTVHVFQNGKVSTLANLTKEWSGAVFDIGVAYESDIDLVTNTMSRVAEDLRADPGFAPLILEPMEVFGVDAFGASEVVIKARIKTKPMQQWTVGREYRKRLKKAFDLAGIDIPFPQRTLWIKTPAAAIQPPAQAAALHPSETRRDKIIQDQAE